MSSTRSALIAFPLFVDHPMDTNGTSPTVQVKYGDNYGIHVRWAETVATLAGVLTVECSVDEIYWDALTFSPSLQQPNGDSDSYLINLNQLPYAYLRLVWAESTGEGLLNAKICGKGW